MSYNKISIVMEIFNYLGSQKIKKLYSEKTRPFPAEFFTGCVSKPIWMIIMSKLENLKIEGTSRQQIF